MTGFINRIVLALVFWISLGVTNMGTTQITEQQLQNGLTVILINDPLTSIASIRTYVRAGSVDEGPLLGAGASHYLEHLVAGGTTTKRDEDAYKTKIAMLGGAFNAYTTLDHTSYFINTTSEYIPEAIEILSEWMFHSSFTDKEFNRERDVIIKEIEKNNASIPRKFYQQSQENFYKHHAIKYPVIGYLDKFKNIKKEELKSYYSNYYCPSNMILVVGGHFEKDKILDLIEKTFGSEPSKPNPLRPITSEPIPFSTRLVEKTDNTTITYISIRFSTIDIFSKDLFPLDLLDYMLGNGDDSTLYRILVEDEKLAYHIHVASNTPDYTTGYFEITAEIDYKNKDLYQKRLFEILEEIKAGKHLEKEQIESAKKQKIADKILGISTIEDKVTEYGQAYLIAHNTHFFDDYISQFKSVSKSDITTAAKNYFITNKALISILSPQVSRNVLGKTTVSPNPTSPNIFVLDNGTRVILLNDKSIPKTLAQVMTLGGIRNENATQNGIGNLTASLIGKNSKKFNKTQIRKLVEGNGADLEARLGQNTIYYTLECLSEDFSLLLPIFLDTYYSAEFTKFDLEESKRKILQQISQRQDDWGSYGNYIFKKEFYQNHPYGLSGMGEKETIEPLTIKDIKHYYETMIDPSQTIITIVGDFDESQVKKDITKQIAELAKNHTSPPRTYERQLHSKTENKTITIPQDVAALFIGFDGTTFANEDDCIKLDLTDAILSGLQYPGGRLHNILREKGLVYMVHATNQPNLDPGCFQIVALTSKDKIDEVKKIISDQILDIQTKPVTDKEFNEAIAQMSFYYKDRVASNESLATILSTDELYGRGIDYYKKLQNSVSTLKKEDIQVTAKKYLKNPQIFVFQGK